MKYKTIIYHYNNSEGGISNKLPKNLSEDGSLFIFFDTIYKDGFIHKNIFDVVDEISSKNYFLANVIVYPKKTPWKTKWEIKQNIWYILWFTQNEEKMFFDKDKIREKHIWKDVEWGRREKNYNKNWKDPGNIWIPTLDDWKWNITKHIVLTNEELINRCLLSTSLEWDNIYIEFWKLDLKKIVRKKWIEYHQKLEKPKIPQKIEPNSSHSNSHYPSKITSNIYFKSSEKMLEIGDKTVNLMVTSPPYWDLKNYFKAWQIWHESYEDYLARMKSVWKETYRVLKDNWSMWININTRKKNKKLISIPYDIIKNCKEIGFYLKDIIIWHKSSGIPVGKKGLVDRHEYFLWFTKSKNPKLNLLNYADYKNSDINNGIIWNINRKAWSVWKDYIHPAIYPTQMIDRIIKLCTTEGDIVLDPFLWSWTSAISSINNKRNVIGYEYNEEFLNLIKYRFEKEIKGDFQNIVNSYSKHKKSEGVIYRCNPLLT